MNHSQRKDSFATISTISMISIVIHRFDDAVSDSEGKIGEDSSLVASELTCEIPD